MTPTLPSPSPVTAMTTPPLASPPEPSFYQAMWFKLSQSALYKNLKRSPLAFMASTFIKAGGKSLWPGTETALAKKLNPDQQYAWTLVDKILAHFQSYLKTQKVKFLVVNIPYLPQVYDNVWKFSFGLKPSAYDRNIGDKRLEKICQTYQIPFLNLTPVFRKKVKEKKRWLHFKQDGHPTAEGQQLMAQTIYKKLKQLGWIPSSP